MSPVAAVSVARATGREEATAEVETMEGVSAVQETSTGKSAGKPGEKQGEKSGEKQGAEPSTHRAATGDPGATVTRRLGGGRLYAGLFAIVGILALAAAGLYLRSTSTDEGLQYAALRDTVKVQGLQDIVVMNSLDSTTFDGTYQSWLSVTTGVLHDQLAQMSSTQKSAITQSGAKSSGKVVEAVVTELDDHAGTAKMLASVELTVTAKDGTSKVARNRFSADLTLDGQQWKLSQLQQVAVGAS